jgi:hypothetical protein
MSFLFNFREVSEFGMEVVSKGENLGKAGKA